MGRSLQSNAQPNNARERKELCIPSFGGDCDCDLRRLRLFFFINGGGNSIIDRDRARREPTLPERTGFLNNQNSVGFVPTKPPQGYREWPPTLLLVSPPVEVYPYPIARVALAPARHSPRDLCLDKGCEAPVLG